MLERGLHEQVMEMFKALSQPQELMYTATIPKEVQKMANSMAKDLTIISIGKPNKPTGAVKKVAIWVESKQKQKLIDILTLTQIIDLLTLTQIIDILTIKQHFKPPAVIFVSSRISVDLLSNAIGITIGIKALSIHAEKLMKERREILKSFVVGEVLVIVATGVLDGGIDLLCVKQVIVFDMLNSIKEYIR